MSKSVGIVHFLKISAQCPHYGKGLNLWQLVCRNNNYSSCYNYFFIALINSYLI